jgi:glycosyltransferase involved in cell wall biosynthesis
MPIKGKTLLHYVPHGINQEVFRPFDKTEKNLVEGKKRFFNGATYDYSIFFNSRNVKRKQVSNVLLAFRIFCDSLSPEEAKRVCLILHTEAVGQNGHGTDLPAVKEAICKNYTVFFSQKKITPGEMNLMYNLSDVTINVSSNEGFGLSVGESIMAGTPIIVNVTGGLQDQIGQVDDNGNPVEFTKEFGTNNIGKYKNHGVWAKPVWPKVLDTHGSNQTPYIFDDMTDARDIAESMMYWYLIPDEERTRRGEVGRNWAINEGGINANNMCNQFITAMDYTLNTFTPSEPFSIHTTDEFVGQSLPDNCMGVDFGKVDIEKVKKEIL